MTTIVAISSAVGRAGIGIVRMSGPKSLEILKSIFKEDREFEDRKMTYGHIIDGDVYLDEVMAVYMQGPRTYTTEDVVEIYTHGGLVAVRDVLSLVLDRGADLAQPGEFTKRAFLNGRLDLAQAEAVIDIIDADTRLGHQGALGQLQGALSDKIGSLRQDLKNILASSITEIDFPEDENDTLTNREKVQALENIQKDLGELLEDSKRGKIIKEGIKTLILGRPNVGKSSLLNGLLKENRAIVTDIPGTTRDVIEELMDLDGLPLRLLDTAGIRTTDDKIEQIGVDLAKSHLEDADLVLLVLDSSKDLSPDDKDLIDLTKDKTRLCILNKADLGPRIDTSLLPCDHILISAKENQGIKDLTDKIRSMFFDDQIDMKDRLYMTNSRQVHHLNKAKKSVDSAIDDLNNDIPMDLVELDINSAIDDLGSITGHVAGEDILDQIFAEFCIGK